ncbi:hypothetical protein AB1Y20_016647 [Prymnesium parvum]|uniref:RING-type domain-containing protein n=1 Tax=Prymnesium parvum TaxID=97485 RepID=A0AB34IE46_PRYPA|mmetsp:Transcript_28803/g.71807  ORF Transcript_28803/g.71807 Transcript_28803/m.71807 type:complete len:335 (-) Transcript_28803:420-1424(-)
MSSRGARVHERTDITVGVVGCGRMGCAIAGEFVRRGCTAVLYDHTEYTRNRAFQTLRASLWDHVANGYLLKQDVEELMGRISVCDTLADTLVKSQVVVESVFEDLTLKKDLFNSMGSIAMSQSAPHDQVLLCSNTMAIPMSDITEDMPKESRGSCIGMRFLHPVWFVDEVELTESDYTRRTTSQEAEKLLKQLFFQPFFFDGCYRRKLTLSEISTYQSRQRLRCPEPIKSVPKRGIRKKFGSPPSHEKEPPVVTEESMSSVELVESASSPDRATAEESEPCAVCLEEPRWALLIPCGHMAMCIDCAEKVLHGTRPICVVCRQPIEKILRAAPPP